jgi:hypothetical protein
MLNKRKIKSHIIAIIENKKTGKREIFECKNIVTDAGDIYYAQRAAAETPTNTFNSLYLGTTGSPSPGKSSNYSSITFQTGSEKVVKATYPKTNDGDSDNTGAGTDVTTWTFEYSAADGNWTGLTEGIISTAGASGTDPILNHFSFGGAFNKDSSTTLKVIINHTANGV